MGLIYAGVMQVSPQFSNHRFSVWSALFSANVLRAADSISARACAHDCPLTLGGRNRSSKNSGRYASNRRAAVWQARNCVMTRS